VLRLHHMPCSSTGPSSVSSVEKILQKKLKN
ncbi:MAG: hypothetical protein ACI8RD_010995, partial [Bacillariaceae sp.]